MTEMTYEQKALRLLMQSARAKDRHEADRLVAAAAVHADLHRTRIMERSLAEDVEPFVKPEFGRDVAPEGPPELTPLVSVRYARDEKIVAVLQEAGWRGVEADTILEVLNEAGFFVIEKVS